MLTPQFFRVPIVPMGSPVVAVRFFRDRLACKTCNPLTECIAFIGLLHRASACIIAPRGTAHTSPRASLEDALIEYTLSNIKRRVGVVHHSIVEESAVEKSACSVYKLMPVAETGDGAITNLVRDERSTKRKTAGVALSVCHLPGSLREVAMETNQAVKQWRHGLSRSR